MRKVLLFAVLFGIGLALLFWFDQRSRPETQLEPEGTNPPPIVDGVGANGGTMQDPDDQSGIQISGAVKIEDLRLASAAGSEEQDHRFFFSAVLDPQGTGLVVPYEATDVVVEVYDRKTDKLIRSARSTSGSFTLDLSKYPEVSIADEGKFELFDLVLDQMSGPIFAPVQVRAEHGEIYLDNQTFRSLG